MTEKTIRLADVDFAALELRILAHGSDPCKFPLDSGPRRLVVKQPSIQQIPLNSPEFRNIRAALLKHMGLSDEEV